jgi:hypothetical protein
MTTLARCTGDGACPVRFRSGPPRPCPDHRDEAGTVATRAAAFDLLMAAPGEDGEPDRQAGIGSRGQGAGPCDPSALKLRTP